MYITEILDRARVILIWKTIELSEKWSAMKVKVRAFGDLMRLLGNESIVELEVDARLTDLVSKLAEKTGNQRRGFLGHYDVRGPDLVILLNGRNIHTLEKLVTSLKDGDVVTLLPPLVGG